MGRLQQLGRLQHLRRLSHRRLVALGLADVEPRPSADSPGKWPTSDWPLYPIRVRVSRVWNTCERGGSGMATRSGFPRRWLRRLLRRRSWNDLTPEERYNRLRERL